MFIHEINRKKRVAFICNHYFLDDTWWHDAIFTDESRFNIFGLEGRVMVWRKENEELKKCNLQVKQQRQRDGMGLFLGSWCEQFNLYRRNYEQERMSKDFTGQSSTKCKENGFLEDIQVLLGWPTSAHITISARLAAFLSPKMCWTTSPIAKPK